jgi:hypothetical protein
VRIFKLTLALALLIGAGSVWALSQGSDETATCPMEKTEACPMEKSESCCGGAECDDSK